MIHHFPQLNYRMKILKKQVLRGPNVWSNYRNKLIQVRLDLEEMEQLPTDKIPGFPQALQQLLPGMVEHECSEGVHGGFFIRLERGTWMGHVIEHVALEIQSLAGMETGYGRTRGTDIKGIYNMVFAYEIEEAGLYAADAAFAIVDALSKGETFHLEPIITELIRLRQRYGLGPSTKSIIAAAEKQNIPWKRLGTRSKIQLGYGKNQQRFQATMTANTSSAAVTIAGDKQATKELLAAAAIPVAKGAVCNTLEELLEIIEAIGFPIVLKPLNGNQGKGASINLTTVEAATMAFYFAQEYSSYVLVEKFITGFDYRLLVIDGKFVAAAKRVPAHIVGDATLSIRELIEKENSNPLRGEGHEAALTKIKFDKDTFVQLEKANVTMEYVPRLGEIIYLKSTANLSTGGTAIDATDTVHADTIFMAERIAKIVGLDICGIDIMAKNITEPLMEHGGVVLEVNAAPGFRMHLSPSEGKARAVGKAVVDMLYPVGKSSTIPLFALTGTNGKTTTTRLLAHMAQSAGYTPGFTTTDGIYIGNHKIKNCDASGPVSGQLILSDPMVDFAVLETARGGILRAGLCFKHADVGIITNIEEDHLGLNDIQNLDDLANVKAVVARSVAKSGTAVLNADDAQCVKIADELDCNIVYFSMQQETPVITEHLSKGKTAVLIDGDAISIFSGADKIVVEQINNIPLTEKGNAKFMIANVMAAVAAAYSYGFTIPELQSALRTFTPSYELTPGRMNLFEFANFKVLVDYAHNPHGFLAMKDYLSNISSTRKIGIIAGIGDRRDTDTIKLASIAATMFDHIIVRQEHGLRGKTVDEINSLVIAGIKEGNKVVTYDLISDETEAIIHALNMAQEGDFIVALSDEHEKVVSIIREHLQKELSAIPINVSGEALAS